MSVFSNRQVGAVEGAEAYVTAVNDLVGGRDPLEILAATSRALEEIVGGSSDETLRRPEAEGKWSMLEVLGHLADGELVWAYRMRVVLAERDPVLNGFDQDRWAQRLRYREGHADEYLRRFRFQRERNLALLESLDADELARSGRHDERGRESLTEMLRLYAGHDLIHLAQLERIRRRHADGSD